MLWQGRVTLHVVGRRRFIGLRAYSHQGVDGLQINPLRKALGVIVRTPIRAVVKSLNIEPRGL